MPPRPVRRGEPVVNSAFGNPLEVGASGSIATTQSFGAHLESALRSVNRLQAESGRLSDGLASGQHQDLVATMVASQKANVAFQAALQVRNRLVSAYESVMNMPI